MNPICIIPARGGSKGLPRKNLLPFCVRPLIAWNILAALEACGECNVFVTTDDAESATVGKHYGARIIHRPAVLAADTASSEDALLHVLGDIRTLQGGLTDAFPFSAVYLSYHIRRDPPSLIQIIVFKGPKGSKYMVTNDRLQSLI